MANTTNFNWETPDDTDLVKDGAAAIRTLGSAIDTSLVDLKGGTTGQILAKATNTDMDFSWITNDVGDITAVTAGTGISGGGTSGSVTITNSMATEIAAKGDLIVGTGSATFDNLTVGTNGHVLTADSTTATGLKWAAAAGGGKVLQVVQGTTTTKTTITTGTFTDTTITATITPSSATSKILVMANSTVYAGQTATTTYVSSNARLMRDSTVLTTFAPFQQIEGASTSGGYSVIDQVSLTYLDSPSTTSAVTYKVQGAEKHATSVIWQQVDSGEPASTGVIILMEIGA